MPVVGGGRMDDIDIVAVEYFSKIAIGFTVVIPIVFVDATFRSGESLGVSIANCDDLSVVER